MHLRQIMLLNEHDKLKHLIMDGECVGERTTDFEHILLFQLSSNYVEVAFAPYADAIAWTRSFTSTDELIPYLNNHPNEII